MSWPRLTMGLRQSQVPGPQRRNRNRIFLNLCRAYPQRGLTAKAGGPLQRRHVHGNGPDVNEGDASDHHRRSYMPRTAVAGTRLPGPRANALITPPPLTDPAEVLALSSVARRVSRSGPAAGSVPALVRCARVERRATGNVLPEPATALPVARPIRRLSLWSACGREVVPQGVGFER